MTKHKIGMVGFVICAVAVIWFVVGVAVHHFAQRKPETLSRTTNPGTQCVRVSTSGMVFDVRCPAVLPLYHGDTALLPNAGATISMGSMLYEAPTGSCTRGREIVLTEDGKNRCAVSDTLTESVRQ